MVFTFNCLCESLWKQVISKSSSKSWFFIHNLQESSRVDFCQVQLMPVLHWSNLEEGQVTHILAQQFAQLFCSPIAKLQFLWVERNRVRRHKSRNHPVKIFSIIWLWFKCMIDSAYILSHLHLRLVRLLLPNHLCQQRDNSSGAETKKREPFCRE